MTFIDVSTRGERHIETFVNSNIEEIGQRDNFIKTNTGEEKQTVTFDDKNTAVTYAPAIFNSGPFMNTCTATATCAPACNTTLWLIQQARSLREKERKNLE